MGSTEPIQEKMRTVEESTYGVCTELWVRENGLAEADPAQQNQEKPTPSAHERPRSDNTNKQAVGDYPSCCPTLQFPPLCSVKHLLRVPEVCETPNHPDAPTTRCHDC